jgi:hypothetical protein
MTNNDIFAARLDRIRSGTACTKDTVFVGMDERFQRERVATPNTRPSHQIAQNLAYPLSFAGAFGLGLIAVAIGYYARFQVMAGQAVLEDADLEMGLAFAIGLALSFVLAQMFRLTSKAHKAAQGVGVFAMVCLFHNFAHWAPAPMSMAFSAEYVQRIQTEAPPHSAQFRGIYFTIFEDPATHHADLAAEGAAVNEAADCAAAAPRVTILQMDSAKPRAPEPEATPCVGG